MSKSRVKTHMSENYINVMALDPVLGDGHLVVVSILCTKNLYDALTLNPDDPTLTKIHELVISLKEELKKVKDVGGVKKK